MNKTKCTERMRPLLILAIAVTTVILWLPSQLLAYSFDFQGTVLYDSHVKKAQGAGFQQYFTGNLNLNNGGSLTFNRNNGSSIYHNPDPGNFLWGQFTQGGVDFFYAYGNNGNTPGIRMGAVWWTTPTTITAYGVALTNVYGIVFHLDGSFFTQGDLIAQRLQDFLFNTGVYSSIHGVIPLTGCSLINGGGFLGAITSNQFPKPPEVPLPASLWFLGCGLLVVWRRLKN